MGSFVCFTERPTTFPLVRCWKNALTEESLGAECQHGRSNLSFIIRPTHGCVERAALCVALFDPVLKVFFLRRKHNICPLSEPYLERELTWCKEKAQQNESEKDSLRSRRRQSCCRVVASDRSRGRRRNGTIRRYCLS